MTGSPRADQAKAQRELIMVCDRAKRRGAKGMTYARHSARMAGPPPLRSKFSTTSASTSTRFAEDVRIQHHLRTPKTLLILILTSSYSLFPLVLRVLVTPIPHFWHAHLQRHRHGGSYQHHIRVDTDGGIRRGATARVAPRINPSTKSPRFCCFTRATIYIY
jgi:hypothetical protein